MEEGEQKIKWLLAWKKILRGLLEAWFLIFKFKGMLSRVSWLFMLPFIHILNLQTPAKLKSIPCDTKVSMCFSSWPVLMQEKRVCLVSKIHFAVKESCLPQNPHSFMRWKYLKVQKLPPSEGTYRMHDELQCCLRHVTNTVCANLQSQSMSDGLAYMKGEINLRMWRIS